MGTKVTSTVMCFFHGRRYRPGVVFELPEGVKPSKDMTVVEDQPKAVKKGADKGTAPTTLSDITKTDSAAQKPKGAGDDLA